MLSTKALRTGQVRGIALAVLTVAALVGCADPQMRFGRAGQAYVSSAGATTPEVPSPEKSQTGPQPDVVQRVSAESPIEQVPAPLPQIATDEGHIQYSDLTLPRCIATAAQNSTVIRDLGGRLMTAPGSVGTSYDPEIKRLNPRYGVEAALSEFDPQLAARVMWDREYFFGNDIGTYPNGFVDRSIPMMNLELSKYNEWGGRMFVRQGTAYEQTDALHAQFGSFWDTTLGIGVRQPLLRGAGRDYNLIAGRSENQDLLLANGLWIARLDTSISRRKLEAALTKLVSDVEEAYWRLSLAYHDLGAKVAARDRAYADWQRTRELQRTGLPGGTVQNEALARADFYALQTEVQDALFGTPTSPGVYEGSRRLNQLMGLPPSPDCILRPVEIPTCCKCVFDWPTIHEEALQQRPEICEQRLVVQRRELQLVAARNTLLPRVDLIAEYDVKGYGKQLAGDGPPLFSAAQTAGEGFYGSTLGVEVVWPIGERQPRSAVRYCELQVCREKAILQEQTHLVDHELAAIHRQMERVDLVAETARLRREAATQNLAASEDAFRVQRVNMDVVVDARRRLAEAQTAYYRALIEYAIELKNLQLVKGSLLAYHCVQLCGEPAREDSTRETGETRCRSKPEVDYRLPELDYRQIDPSRRLPDPQKAG
jgi:outer membrane protein TolC